MALITAGCVPSVLLGGTYIAMGPWQLESWSLAARLGTLPWYVDHCLSWIINILLPFHCTFH